MDKKKINKGKKGMGRNRNIQREIRTVKKKQIDRVTERQREKESLKNEKE